MAAVAGVFFFREGLVDIESLWASKTQQRPTIREKELALSQGVGSRAREKNSQKRAQHARVAARQPALNLARSLLSWLMNEQAHQGRKALHVAWLRFFASGAT